MAKYTVVKYGVCMLSSKDTFIQHLVFTLFTFILLLESSAFARPTPEHEPANGNQEHDHWGVTDNFHVSSSSWLGVVVSLAFLITLASLLALCGAGGCCGEIHWFGRSRQEAHLSFSNPMTDPGSTMMVPISQIDVRALELDPIVFEPLPTISDLTPLSNKTHSTDHRSGHYTDSRNHAIPIIPFSADDSAVYAHDWFEEPHVNFPRRNVEYIREIGKGWFGQVIEAEARDIVPFAKTLRVVVKLLREDANGIEQMRFLDEARMYRDGDHGNILKLMGHSIEKLPFLLILEYCPQGDLKSFLISNVIRAEMLNSQGTIVKMALDVAKGLEWLHNAGFIHPDLAARNCQVSSENRVVIGDYGLGTQNYKDDYHWSSMVAIPLRWTAPETLHCTSSVIQILKVTETSNIWTLGVVIWEICEFGKLPYSELSDDEVINRVIVEKNYHLSQPTLPSMSAKDELYKIMSGLWEPELENRPRLCIIVRQLEELYSSFLDAQPTSIKQINPSLSSPRDEFDTKWDQLSGRTNSSEDYKQQRKKIVSFRDLESQVTKKIDFEKSFLSEESEQSPYQSNKKDQDSIKAEGTSGPSSLLSAEVKGSDSNKEADLDEEQWTKKIERGDISQKVLEKSQSVQDLMVLTHFEQSDDADYDSLLFVAKPSLQGHSNQQQHQTTPSPSKDENSGGDNKNQSLNDVNDSAVSSSSVLKKSNSDTPIDGLSLYNSSHTLTPGSCESSSSHNTLVPQDSKSSPFSSSSTLSVVQPPKINLINASPNPSVEINVIAPTPNRTASTTPPANHHHQSSSQPTASIDLSKQNNTNGNSSASSSNQSNTIQNKRLHFNFDSVSSPPAPGSVVGDEAVSPTRATLSTGQFRQQRLTSTPRRSGSTPSPRVSDFEFEEENGDVFESTSGYYMDGTFGLSPISQSYVSVGSLNSSGIKVENSVVKGSSILFGACDDHELGSYQGVKSQLFEASKTCSESNDDTAFTMTKDDTPMVIPDSGSNPDIREIPRRILFRNGISNDEGEENGKTDISSVTSSVWEIGTGVSGSMLTFDEPKVNGSIREEHTKQNKEKVKENGIKSEINEHEDEQEFWKTQFKSLQMAADSTRELLFQTGLNESEPVATTSSDKRFVEDIEQDVEELGSLVLHDLEEPDSLQTIIKEKREPWKIDDGVSAAKLAFHSSSSTTSSAVNNPFETGFINSTTLTDRDGITISSAGSKSFFHSSASTIATNSSGVVLNAAETNFINSINSESGKCHSKSWDNANSLQQHPDGETHISNEVQELKENSSDEEDGDKNSTAVAEGDINSSTDFVPSKWNNSLIPSRSAIKSPEQQTLPKARSSGMKKSVSFEMKKTHLVYEYPPPPVASDSEGSDSSSEEPKQHKIAPRNTTAPSAISLPLASSLDWELTQEELEDAEINNEDWDEDVVEKRGDPMDVYRISGISEDNFQVRCSNEPFVFSPPSSAPSSSSTTLGELRHTRDKLRLDLSRGEANFLDDDLSRSSSNPAKLDSGVGSSTNVSPFNTNCDILTKRSKDSD